jgi:PAS domain S-box-containing protein
LSEQIQKAITDVKNTGAIHQIEYILPIRNKPAWFNAKISSRYSLKGTFNGVTIVVRNITDSKLSNIKLQESEEKYRALFNRANDVICVIQDGVIRVCNPLLEEFWGGPLDEVIGRRFTDLVHVDSVDDITDRYNRRIAGERVPSLCQTVLKRKDGSRSYVELNAGIISYEGRPADLVIIRDMNDRKRVEDALRKSEELYRTIAETSNDLIFVIGRDDRVEYVNTCASAFIHKPVDQIIGKPRSSLFPREVAVNQKKALQKVFETGTSVRNEGPLTILGRTHWYDHYLIPLKDPDGTIRSVLGISRDITDRKNTAGPD